jgi:hypothetical protein
MTMYNYRTRPKKNNKFSIKDEFTFDYNSIYEEYLFKKRKKMVRINDEE